MTSTGRLILVPLGVVAFLALAAPSRHRAVTPPIDLNMRRSFVVTDKAILEGFSFDRVLGSIIARSGITGLTTAQFYRQWLDTQNAKPGLADPAGPHCNDFMDGGTPSFNGFPRRCPTLEGALAAQSYGPNEYIPIALVNRFDLTPPDGSNCGQYRIIFARRSNQSDRLHMIFEAVLPNPNREAGLAGCRPVAEFWAGLTDVDSMLERRARLEAFFFDGISGFPPVVHPDHFGVTGGGVRTTQFTWPGVTRMYSFRVTRECAISSGCTLRMTPDVLENQPFGRLFDSTDSNPRGPAFRDVFVGQVANLAIPDINLYFMDMPREFLMAESDPLDGEPAFLYVGPFIHGAASQAGQEFRNRIQQELTRVGSTLPPEIIVARAESVSCVGCHSLFAPIVDHPVPPTSIEHLQQVSEDRLEDGEGGPQSRYAISLAMRVTFVPHRMQILRDFLTYGTPPVHSKTIGGGRAVQ